MPADVNRESTQRVTGTRTGLLRRLRTTTHWIRPPQPAATHAARKMTHATGSTQLIILTFCGHAQHCSDLYLEWRWLEMRTKSNQAPLRDKRSESLRACHAARRATNPSQGRPTTQPETGLRVARPYEGLPSSTLQHARRRHKFRAHCKQASVKGCSQGGGSETEAHNAPLSPASPILQITTKGNVEQGFHRCCIGVKHAFHRRLIIFFSHLFVFCRCSPHNRTASLQTASLCLPPQPNRHPPASVLASSMAKRC